MKMVCGYLYMYISCMSTPYFPHCQCWLFLTDCDKICPFTSARNIMISTWRNVQPWPIETLHFLWLFFSFFFFWSVVFSYSFLSCGMFSSNSVFFYSHLTFFHPCLTPFLFISLFLSLYIFCLILVTQLLLYHLIYSSMIVTINAFLVL